MESHGEILSKKSLRSIFIQRRFRNMPNILVRRPDWPMSCKIHSRRFALRPPGRRPANGESGMYPEPVDLFAAAPPKKAEYLGRSPGGFLLTPLVPGPT